MATDSLPSERIPADLARNVGSIPGAKNFAELDPRNALFMASRVCSRAIVPYPRPFLVAKGLFGATAYLNHFEGISGLAEASLSGRPLWPWLSTAIIRPNSPRDLLLDDWGIHHFHLGNTKNMSSEKFAPRTSDLLFAIVRPDAVVGFAIGKHQEWGCGKLGEAALKLLGEDSGFRQLNGTMGGADMTKTERQALRQANFTTLLSHKESVFVSFGWGTKVRDRLLAQKSLKNLRWLERLALANCGRLPLVLNGVCMSDARDIRDSSVTIGHNGPALIWPDGGEINLSWPTSSPNNLATAA